MPMIQALPGAQQAFLGSTCDVAVFATKRGGGKTYALLLDPLHYIAQPDFSAVIFKHGCYGNSEYWETTRQVYSIAGGRCVDEYKTWIFPNGGRIKIADIATPDAAHSWQGTSVPMIGFDNLEQFSEESFWYMRSRNRSSCTIKPYMRATVDAGNMGWVADLAAWYLDPDTNDPIPNRSGVTRWFVRYDGNVVWADSAQELRTQFPDPCRPSSFTLISGSRWGT